MLPVPKIRVRDILRRCKPIRVAHMWYWRVVGQWLHIGIKAFVTRRNYGRCLKVSLNGMNRQNGSHRRSRVLFPLQELAKWKMQSVIEFLKQTDDFEPVVAFVVADIWWNKKLDEVMAEYQRISDYFEPQGVSVVLAHDFMSGQALSFESFRPNVVFYQQPWFYAAVHMPRAVSYYALTFYMPYFAPNYELINFMERTIFHRTLYRFCVMNETEAQVYRRNISRVFRAGDFVATGHPMLDQIDFQDGRNSQDGVVIYAPHWSITHPNNPNSENYSTFLDTGLKILRFAQEHPEVKWAFKPHPTLRITLQRTQVWREEEIADYYSAWERIGEVCVSGPYLDLFSRSRLMITDCGSFLTEYACTGNPILRLKNKANTAPLCVGIRDLYATYYQAETNEELQRLLQMLVLDREDPDRAKRLMELQRSGLRGKPSAPRVVALLRESVYGVKEKL